KAALHPSQHLGDVPGLAAGGHLDALGEKALLLERGKAGKRVDDPTGDLNGGEEQGGGLFGLSNVRDLKHLICFSGLIGADLVMGTIGRPSIPPRPQNRADGLKLNLAKKKDHLPRKDALCVRTPGEWRL